MNPDELVLRDVVTFNQDGPFRPADYPWLVAVRVTAKGGQGGAAADGTPGADGETGSTELIPVADLPAEVPVIIGRGGKGATPDVSDGRDGYVLVELYAHRADR